MSTQRLPTYGACPRCEADIDQHSVLVEYETTDGDQRAFAECPECRSVVSPTEVTA